MDADSVNILKKLIASREMTVRDVAALLPKRTNDHLDLYVLAHLIKNGFADVVITHDGKAFRESSEMEMAITLYTWASKGKGEFEYRGMRVSGADFRDEKIFATAKGALLLQEMESKRNERLWAFAVGIVTAVVAAILTGLLS